MVQHQSHILNEASGLTDHEHRVNLVTGMYLRAMIVTSYLQPVFPKREPVQSSADISSHMRIL